MTSDKHNGPGNPTPEGELELERELAQLAHEESADVQRAELMRSAQHEEDILAAFRDKVEEEKPKPRSIPSWVWPMLVAASVAFFFAAGGFGSKSADVPDDGPLMGTEEDQAVRISSREDGKVWFELELAIPHDGYLALKILDGEGNLIAETDRLDQPKWCYDSTERGALPEQVRVEVTTWLDGIDGAEEYGDRYVQDLQVRQ